MDTIEVDDRAIDGPGGAMSSGAGYQGVERRRPGRPQEISPHLVALLRSDERRPAPILASDAQRAAIGLGAALLLSVPLWAMLGIIAWALLG